MRCPGHPDHGHMDLELDVDEYLKIYKCAACGQRFQPTLVKHSDFLQIERAIKKAKEADARAEKERIWRPKHRRTDPKLYVAGS